MTHSLAFDDYQIGTRRTATYPDALTGSSAALSYLMLGLNGEAGEAAEKYKKVLRDDAGVITPSRLAAILKELGDTQWYLARIADELNIALSRIAVDNLAKADDRARRGVLSGSGDNR